MIGASTNLLPFQLAGEVIARGLGLPVPGPVLGMLFLFAFLCWRGQPAAPLRDTAETLLRHLSLLFVPAGTGIVVHLHRVADEWLPLLVALVASTVLTLVVTALAMQGCRRLAGRGGDD